MMQIKQLNILTELLMKHINTILLFSVLILFTNSTYASEYRQLPSEYHQDARNFFYQHPNVNQLLQIAEYPNDSGSPMPRQVFINLALAKHPKMDEDVMNNFAKLSPNAQQLFINAFYANNVNAVKLSEKYHLTPQQTLNTAAVNNLVINDNAGIVNLDILWNAYFATGDIMYPEKMLRFICNNDPYILKVAQYIAMGIPTCEHMGMSYGCPLLPIDEITHDLKRRYPAQANTIFHHTTTVAIALLSMNDIRQTDSILNKNLTLISNRNPNLNYLATVWPSAQQTGFWNISVPIN